MKEVFIKYNPYKLETEIKVDGKKLAKNSVLGEKSADGSRLQEWVEELPNILIDEYNDTEFNVTFHGTLLDYEDLTAVFTEAHERGDVTGGSLDRKEAKETSDKEKLIEDVFAEIQKGPFEELKDDAIIHAFTLAKSSDFELCVVATMSSGKSTLINAMLGTKLMPSKQEACTAIITRIKDVSDNEKTNFKAEVYNSEGRLSETQQNLTYEIMNRLNSDERVSEIKISGDIPFVTSEDISLVMIDTPGPNNSRDPNHKKVQSELLSKSSKSLVLYIMTGEFGTDDDNALLKRVAESMQVGGKQSKDRFVFVVNKLDGRKKEDGSTEETLERVREYLKTHGIINPNLFPAAALPALSIRQFQSGEITEEEDEDDVLDMETAIKKFNRNKNGNMHFENYASLPASLRGEINSKLDAERMAWQGNDNENPNEALIHTGVVSIESAIRQYVQKYAKTAKIKNIVDTFTHKLDEIDCFTKTQKELVTNQEEAERIVRMINKVEAKMADGKDAQKFKNAVDNAVVKVGNDSGEKIEEIMLKFRARITKRIDEIRGRELSINDADDEVERLNRFAQNLAPDFEVELNEIIQNSLIKTSADLLDKYKNKLASLAEEINGDEVSSIKIDPLKLMSGSVNMSEFSAAKFIEEKEVEDGEEYVENTSKKWYKPWTWFQEKGYYRTKYKTVEFIDGSTLAQEFFTPITETLSENGDAAQNYAQKQSKKIAENFNKEFKRLDDVLIAKFKELKSYATDKEKAEERIEESKKRLEWLNKIKEKVDSILEI